MDNKIFNISAGIKNERTSPIFMPHTQNSAFKPIYHQNDKHNDLPFTTSTPELIKKPSKSLLINNNRDESSSSSSLSSSSIGTFTKTPTVTPAAALNPLMHPFYIDKIFNFQNMFLFSNPGANGGNNDGIATTPNQTTSTNILSQTSSEIQNAMHHSLLQGFYNYYNSSTLLTNSESKPTLPSKQVLPNENPKKSTARGNTSFSIDSILGRKNPALVKNPDPIKINEQLQSKTQNFDYWTLYAAHQYFSQVRSQSQAPTPFNLQNTHNNKNSYSSLETQQNQQIDNLQAKLFTANIAQQQQQTQLPISSLNTNSQVFMKQLDQHKDQQQQQQNPVVKSKNAKKYKCDLCGRGFSRSNTLITHRRIHTGEKPFECNICGRAFRQPGNLTRHKLTHTSIKPYSCNKCGKSFNRVSNLHAHIKIHSDGKPFVCIVCGVSFYQKIDLKIHSLQHTGTKQHECTFCKRKFKQAAHLKYHLHSHLKQINDNSGGYQSFNANQNSTDDIKFESHNENSSNNMLNYGISNDNNNLSKTTEDDDEDEEEDNEDNEMSYNEDVDEEDIDIDDNSDENEINQSADKNNVDHESF